MAKKDFAAINTEKQETGVATGEVYTAIERGKSTYQQQGTASPEEQLERAQQLRTQGRKGCKAVRINMAITPENHKFIKVMSQITGQSMTEFTNFVVERYRTEHPEVYAQAKAIIDSIENE